MSKLLTADLASKEISRLLHNRDLHLVPFCASVIHILFVEFLYIKSHKLSFGEKRMYF